MSRRIYRQSEISLFLKCGRAWEFRYVQGIKTPPRAALVVGSAVDRAVSTHMTEKVKTGQDIPLEQALDAYSTEFEARRPETEWGDDDPGQQKDMGAKLVQLHHTVLAPKIQPATVQEEFHIETDAGYDLAGVIDLTERSGIVVDTKTSNKAYAEDAISRAIQPALYDFAYEALHGKPSTGFRFDVLRKPLKIKPADVQQVSAKVTADDRQWLFDTIADVNKAITAGVALPAADGAWWCSREWCGFASVCPKFKGRK